MAQSKEKQFALDGFLDVSAKTRAKLQALANEMLIAAKDHGLGFDEVREAAETRGWLTGKEPDRSLSFGSSIMKKAGGIVVRHRRSRHPNAHGRLVAVYVHKQYKPLPYDAEERTGRQELTGDILPNRLTDTSPK